MPIPKIMEGLKMFDEPAQLYWDAMMKVFGHEFFLPIIEKLYGGLFVQNMER